MLDLSRLGSTPDGLDGLGEVRRGIAATASHEQSAMIWLYIGMFLGSRYPETAAAMRSVLQQHLLKVDALERAATGIARAAGDRSVT